MPFLVYLIALVITATSVAIGVDFLSTPAFKPATHAASTTGTAVKQIPLGKTASADRGDPNNALTPLYPTAPGKDLPQPQTKVDQAKAEPAAPTKVGPVARTETVGSSAARAQVEAAGSAQDAQPSTNSTTSTTSVAPAPVAPTTSPTTSSTAAVTAAPVSATAPAAPVTTPNALTPNASTQNASIAPSAAPNSCAVQACASAYRSFRASDCSYQPYGGPRKTCDVTGDGLADGLAQAQTVARPPATRDFGRARAQNRDDEFEDVVRTVRRLPRRDAYVEEDDDGRIVVIQQPDGSHYDLRRNWIYEDR